MGTGPFLLQKHVCLDDQLSYSFYNNMEINIYIGRFLQ